MKTWIQNVSFVFYGAFAFYFWIERERPTAYALLLTLGILTALYKPARKGLSLVAIVLVTHLSIQYTRVIPYFRWPLDLFIAAGFGFIVLKWFFKEHWFSLNWSFRFTKTQWLSVFIINVPAIFILSWYFRLNPDVAAQFPAPEVSKEWLVPVILSMAIVNGIREEMLYRGLFQPLSSNTFSFVHVIFFQAIFFGVFHFHGGFPQGWIGVGLTALWGAAIAIQYRIYNSIALSWVTHAMADAIMFFIILNTTQSL